MSENQHEKDNVINLAEKGKRQATLYRIRPGQNGKGQGKKKKKHGDGHGLTWVHYVQFFAFLAVLAMMMQYCGGGM